MSTTGDDANNGSQGSPVRTLNRAVALAPAGGTIVIRGGVYRDWYHDASGNWGFIGKALTFQNFPHEQVWFDGTDIVPSSSFTADSLGRYSLAWSTPQFCQGQYYSRALTDQSVSPNNGPCAHYDNANNPSNPMAMDPQMVFVDGVQLRQVADVSQLTPSSFVYDWTNRKVVLGFNPAGHQIEVTKRPIAMILANKTSYTIRGIGFRKYATNEYNNLTQAAVYVGSSMAVFENDVFSQNAAGGVMLYNPVEGSALRHNVFADNGYTGLWQYSSASSPVNNLVIDSNVFEHNNAEGFGEKCAASCGQAALKLTQIKGATITNNLVENSGGPANGIWCDLACVDVNITYNVVRNQNNRGIFYEVSDRGVIAANLVVNNNYGIVVGSAHTRVYNNTMINNNNGIWVYDDTRQYGVGGWTNVGPDTTATELVGNVLWGTQNYSFKISTQVNGQPASPAVAAAMITRMDHNVVYAGAAGQTPNYVWWQTSGTTLYKTLAGFQQATGLEGGSVWANNPAASFVDPSAGDYRLAAAPTGLADSLPGDIAGLLGGIAGQLLPGAFGPGR
ncbi:right-handed parallel beta-helix repeat-containing protein [Microlunatus kandeliicorticis]|uniref:right-handed parallel beta-helix repeat-containing protein n=1 Tax=Microlunatus kandeliicorticis TaxID=1759536 RepID=UPI0038B2EFFC